MSLLKGDGEYSQSTYKMVPISFVVAQTLAYRRALSLYLLHLIKIL